MLRETSALPSGMLPRSEPRPGPRRFFRRIAAARPLSEVERMAVAAACAPPADLDPAVDLLVEGEPVRTGYILEEGWACRYRLLNDGRRQILTLLVPGDEAGASAGLVRTADHSVATLTPCRVYPVPAASLQAVQQQHPVLRRAFAWSARRDLAIMQEHVVDLGRRTARERFAHLVLELLCRLRLVGLADDDGFTLPLTQGVLADVLGLSIVHVNRTLRWLNDEGLVRYRPGRLEVVDIPGLTRVAEFDEDYLHHAPPGRPP